MTIQTQNCIAINENAQRLLATGWKCLSENFPSISEVDSECVHTENIVFIINSYEYQHEVYIGSICMWYKSSSQVSGCNQSGDDIYIDLGKQDIVTSLYWKSIALPKLEGIKGDI